MKILLIAAYFVLGISLSHQIYKDGQTCRSDGYTTACYGGNVLGSKLTLIFFLATGMASLRIF